jgi:hypothetical protein
VKAPRDTLDLPARDGARRAIPWSAPLPQLDEERRARLVHAWRWRMEQEHLAVGVFCELARELADLGCEPVVLSMMTRAATDEVRHADICRRVAELHGGVELARGRRGTVEAPVFRDATREQAVMFRIVETCCISETFTVAYFTEMLEVATHPIGEAVVRSLLEDEVDHGRVGWAYLASAPSREGLAEMLPELVAVTVAPVIENAERAPEPDDPELLPHGYLGTTRGADIYRRTLHDVILPGFDAIGVDTRATRELVQLRGW